MIHVLYLVEESMGDECFVALIERRGRVQELSASRHQGSYYLEWEEVSLIYPELLGAQGGSLVHLIFLGNLTPEDGIKFVFPGQGLCFATLNEERAHQALIRERVLHGESFAHLWSVPLGWEAPGLHEFLGIGKRNTSNDLEDREKW